MIRLEIRSTSATLDGWRFLWLKSVFGFNPNMHCAKCLNGNFNLAVRQDMPVNSPLPLEYPTGQVIYLCGVDTAFRWANNFHLAMLVTNNSDDVVALPAYTGDTIAVSGVQRLDFDASVALADYAGLSDAFLRCRNFQFGAWASRHGFIALQPGEGYKGKTTRPKTPKAKPLEYVPTMMVLR